MDCGQNKKFLVRASYLEIYNEELLSMHRGQQDFDSSRCPNPSFQPIARIRDLLSKNPKQKLELKDHPEGGVFVKDLTNMIVKGAPDLQQVMEASKQCPVLACSFHPRCC